MSVRIYLSPFTATAAVASFDYEIRDADTGTVVVSETGSSAKTVTVPLRRAYQVVLSNMAGLPGVRHFARVPEGDLDALDNEDYYVNPTLQPTGESVKPLPTAPAGPLSIMAIRVFSPDGTPVVGAVVLVRMPGETTVIRGTTLGTSLLKGTAVISVPRQSQYYLEVQVPGYPSARPVLTGKPFMQYDVVMTQEPTTPLYNGGGRVASGLPTVAWVGIGLVALFGLSALLGTRD